MKLDHRHCEEAKPTKPSSPCFVALDCFAEPVPGRRHSASKTRVTALLAPIRVPAMTAGQIEPYSIIH
jgi:hypothetical protein